MNYPKRAVKKGESDKNLVKEVQKQLNAKGCGPIQVDGDFGNKTVAAVKLFQSRFADQNGNPLLIDGVLGSLSWAALFGVKKVSSTDKAPNKLLTKALEIAKTQIGVMEKPPGSNTGPEISKYLNSVGINFPAAWCMSFVYWCFNEAAKELKMKNPVVKTGGVLAGWNKATCTKIPVAEATANPALVKPGQIFVISHSGGLGHTGIVEKVEGGFITSIEGNTNDGGSREGIGVFRRNSRKISSINKGFLQYQ